jgi:hypothetical protein
MNATMSPAHERAAGLSKYLRLALPQAARVTVVGFALFGLVAVATASASGAVSYGKLCSLLVASMTLTGFFSAFADGVRMIVTQEPWHTFIIRFTASAATGVALALLVPTP